MGSRKIHKNVVVRIIIFIIKKEVVARAVISLVPKERDFESQHVVI
jgi:hypothetical protein